MKYIDADRLRAEIEDLIVKYSSVEAKGPILEGYKGGRLIGYRDVINKLNSLQQEQPQVADASKMEQPEVELEEEISRTYRDGSVADTSDMDHVSYENIARHFAEWGAKHSGAV